MAVQCRKEAVHGKSVTAVKQGKLPASKASLLEQVAGNIQEVKELPPTPNSINTYAKDSADKAGKHKDAVRASCLKILTAV